MWGCVCACVCVCVCPPQCVNFALVPLYVRTSFTGCCAFIWATFLCFSRQSGDGTAGAALAWLSTPLARRAGAGPGGEPGTGGPQSGVPSKGEEKVLVAKERAAEAGKTKAD